MLKSKGKNIRYKISIFFYSGSSSEDAESIKSDTKENLEPESVGTECTETVKEKGEYNMIPIIVRLQCPPKDWLYGQVGRYTWLLGSNVVHGYGIVNGSETIHGCVTVHGYRCVSLHRTRTVPCTRTNPFLYALKLVV